MVLTLLLAAAASTPRVLVAGTAFDELGEPDRKRLVQLTEEALIAAACTVRVSDCRDEACVKAEASSWNAGALVLVSAARLGRDVSVVFKALTAAGKPLSRGDAMVDVKKLAAVGPELEKFARELAPQVPRTAAPAPLEPPAPEPLPEPAPPAPEPVTSVEDAPQGPPAVKSYTGFWLTTGAVAMLVASLVCFGAAAGHDGQLGGARTVGADGVGRWSITRTDADALRGAVRVESTLGGMLGVLAAGFGIAALIAW